ncbi:hypothetical protein [Streptosporangium vulgare]|uniref:Uncharacterized protein n=1 Tax=Streptosporangium vulgare TaxID=46190 RepID=A0ABV5TSF6_9ACTN
MLLLLALLAGAVGIMIWTRTTKWYELLIIGGLGMMVGAVMAGARTFDALSLQSLWSAVFG